MKVYKLVWQRFLASQMAPALFDQTTVDIDAIVPESARPTLAANPNTSDDGRYQFRVNGSVLKFDGFLKVYEEAKDAKDEEDEALKHKLPPLVEGQKLKLRSLNRNSTSPNRSAF